MKSVAILPLHRVKKVAYWLVIVGGLLTFIILWLNKNPFHMQVVQNLGQSHPQNSYLTGTTIFVARTQLQVVVGADSKQAVIAKGNDGYADAGTICKIHQSDDIFFATSGIHADALGTYNVVNTVKQIHIKGESFSVTAKKFEEAIMGALQRIKRYFQQAGNKIQMMETVLSKLT